MSASHRKQQHETRDDDAERKRTQLPIVELREHCDAATPALRRRERQQPFEDQKESQTRE